MPVQAHTADADTHSPRHDGPDTPVRLLMHAPDITLKGKNQDRFQRQLVDNVRLRLQCRGLAWPVGSARGRIYADASGRDADEIERALDALETVPGITSLSCAVWLQPRVIRDAGDGLVWPLLEETMTGLAAQYEADDRSYCVRVNRVDKTLPVRSQDMESRLGAVIRARTDWQQVNLSRPDRTFYIDAYPDGLYLYADKRQGVGGLPVGTGGRLLGLLSGGIDSPVAAFMMAKRGSSVDLLHVTASHLSGPRLRDSVIFKLARQVSHYSQETRLYVAPNTHFDLALSGPPTGYELVLFRRFLMQLAEALAGRTGARALITGDSLGQVASQTIENLTSAWQCIELPVLQPLIGLNKQEIIEQARHIDTYDISIQPYKDCCALIGRNPRTRSREPQVRKLEATVIPDYERLIDATLADLECYRFRCGEFVAEQDPAA